MTPLGKMTTCAFVVMLSVGSLPAMAQDLAAISTMPQAFFENYASQYGGVRRLPAPQREAARAAAEKAWQKMSDADRKTFIDQLRQEREARVSAQETWFASLSPEQRAQVRADQQQRDDAQRAQMLPDPFAWDPTDQRLQPSTKK
jgi:hypothetical protein